MQTTRIPHQLSLDHPESHSAQEHSLLIHVKGALPQHFYFYHLGEVRRSIALHARNRTQDQRVFFQLSGEVTGVFILSIPRNQDLSIYLEMGNILLGRITAILSVSAGLEVMFSPPQVISEKQTLWISDWIKKPGIDTSYDFLNQTQSELFDAHFRLSDTREIGNA